MIFLNKTKDLAKKANYMLHTISCCDRLTKSMLFMSFCLSLSGSAIYLVPCLSITQVFGSDLNILRRIWGLPHRCHTSLLHFTAALDSVFNTAYVKSLRLVNSAINSDSIIFRDVFYHAELQAGVLLCNCGFGWKHLKFYTNKIQFLPASCAISWLTRHSIELL